MSEHNNSSEAGTLTDRTTGNEMPKFPVKQVVISGVCLAIVLALFQQESIQKFSNDFLKLTPTDIFYIPIAAFLFLIFWRLMEVKVVVPFLKLHEARERATTGSMDEAEAMSAKASQIAAEAEESLLAARREALTEKIEVISESKARASSLLVEAENQAKEQKRAAAEAAASENSKLEEELASQSPELVEQLVNKLKETPEGN